MKQQRVVVLLLTLVTFSAWHTAALHRSIQRVLQGEPSGLLSDAEYRLPLVNHRNVQYMASLTIGRQTIPAIYDTGSFQILVLSTKCKACINGTAPIYDSHKSTSFCGSSEQFTFAYGSGEVLGERGFDVIRFGGESSPFVANAVPFWQVIDNRMPIWGRTAKFSAIVGLGHPDVVPDGYGPDGSSLNYLSRFAKLESDRDTPLMRVGIRRFGMCLQRDADVAPGWIIIRPVLTPGIFSSIHVTGRVHWAATLTGFAATGMHFENPCNPSCGAIVDSGTSSIGVPVQARTLINRIRATISFDCRNLHDLPTLIFRFGSLALELPPKAYVLQENGWCSDAFLDVNSDSQLGPVFILGMAFLRYYTVVFDKDSMKLHVARHSPDCQASSASMNFLSSNSATSTNGSKIPITKFDAADFVPTFGSRKDAEATLPAWLRENRTITI